MARPRAAVEPRAAEPHALGPEGLAPQGVAPAGLAPRVAPAGVALAGLAPAGLARRSSSACARLSVALVPMPWTCATWLGLGLGLGRGLGLGLGAHAVDLCKLARDAGRLMHHPSIAAGGGRMGGEGGSRCAACR